MIKYICLIAIIVLTACSSPEGKKMQQCDAASSELSDIKVPVYAWLEGRGRNNVPYMYFGSYEYTATAGGICNGITAGLYDETDIDLNRGYLETGKDNDWRWAEQWLPHSTWYLIAIAIR